MRSPRSLELGPDTYRRVTAGALVALAAIIVTGAAVRLSGSGMGCPTWPSCEAGSLVPRGATGHHGWIEFLNRVVTGLVSVAVILAVLGALRRRPYRPDLTRWSLGLVAGVFAQALLGGLVVFLHVAPVAVAGHYLLSAVLVWNAVVLHERASTDAAPAARPARAPATPVVRAGRVMVVLAASVLVSGTFVTGSGPHGGDEAADRLPFAVTTVARTHSVIVWTFLAACLVTVFLARRSGAGAVVLGRAQVLLGAVVAQGAIGYVQYANDVPELLVGGHVLGSVVVWIAALRLHLALCTSPAAVTAAAPTATAATVPA